MHSRNRQLLIGIGIGVAAMCLLCAVLPVLASFGYGFVDGFWEAVTTP